MDDITSIDLYELLGIVQTSSSQEIKKAYRKKALTCHPDKNPDNPEAVALFLRLSKALEVLIDETARAAYDKVLNARNLASHRKKKLDAARQKLKDELEAREQQARSYSCFTSTTKSDEARLRERIDLLRREGSKQLQEEVEYIKKKVFKHMSNLYSDCRLKINWSVHDAYDAQKLNTIFSKYGKITALIVSQKNKGSALIEFSSSNAAENAINESGSETNPLKVQSLFSANRHKHYKSNKPNYSSPTSESVQSVRCEMDEFESQVFNMLKQAQKRKTPLENTGV